MICEVGRANLCARFLLQKIKIRGSENDSQCQQSSIGVRAFPGSISFFRVSLLCVDLSESIFINELVGTVVADALHNKLTDQPPHPLLKTIETIKTQVPHPSLQPILPCAAAHQKDPRL